MSVAVNNNYPSKTNDDKNCLVVVSYNLRIDADPPPHRWADRVKHAVENLRNCDADIICLQEFTPNMNHSEFKEAFSDWIWNGKYRSKKSPESNPVLFKRGKWQIVSNQTFMYTANKDGYLECSSEGKYCPKNLTLPWKHQRIFTAATVVHLPTGRNLVVVNTHWPLEPDFQQLCSTQLAAFVATQSLPVIVTGDFNCLYDPKLVKNLNLEDCHDWSTQTTFGSFEQGLDANRTKLDFIMYSKLRVLEKGISSFRYDITKRPSDHELIWSVLSF